MFNSKKIKNVICLLTLFLLILSIKSVAVVSPTKDFFVNDYAGVLTEETENYIIQTNIELQQKTGAQIVVVTVESLEGMDIEEYSMQLARNFQIGNAEKNNGVLMLCSIEDRKFRIEVGYELEGKLTDGRTGIIQDEYIRPYLRKNDYDSGIINCFNEILQDVAEEYNITISSVEFKDNETEYSDEFENINVISLFIMIFISILKYKKLSIRITKSKIIYLCILAIIGGIFTKSITETSMLLMVNIIIYGIICLFKARIDSFGDYSGDGGFFQGGDSSGDGGYSGGGGSFRWWRKHKRFLENIIFKETKVERNELRWNIWIRTNSCIEHGLVQRNKINIIKKCMMEDLIGWYSF